jgi:hypothetical protein
MNSVIVVCKRCWRAAGENAVQLLGGVFAVLLLCLPAFSQGSFGRILGTVTDQSGGVVVGATVTVIDTERGVTRVLTTDAAGAYNAPNLTASNYTVRVEAKGFKALERQNVGLEVGHELRVDLIVQPGPQDQVVTVTESVPLVETTNASMGGTLQNTDIIDLPLNGRDYQNLLSLRPGVMLQPGGGPWTESANGVRPDETVWMVEGVINFDFYQGNPIMDRPNVFTDGATLLSLDAIQEVNIIENPKAEYGWKAGAVVNVGIKSGTNQLHGDAYAFGRYQGWDARNFFNIAPVGGSCTLNPADPAFCDQTQAQLKQFGGVVGGPIKKDKLFFFASYEGLRSFIQFNGDVGVPATLATGNPATSMVDAITALQAVGITPSPVSMKLAGCTGGATSVCTGNFFPNTGTSTAFFSNFPTVNTSDNGVAKIDYHPNDKNTINGMFYYGHYNGMGEAGPTVNVIDELNAPTRAWSGTASWVYTPNSTVVNEMRFGYDRLSFKATPLNVSTPANGTGNIPIDTGVTDPLAGGLPSIVIAGFGNGASILGAFFNYPQYGGPMPYYDFQESVSILKGKHSIKFGGEFTHIESDSALYNTGRGRFDFFGGTTPLLTDCTSGGGVAQSCPLEDFFAGNPTNAQVQTGNPALRLTWMSTAGYIQDDWRVTPKVILNLGLRYQYVTPMKDANDNIGSFDPNVGMVQQGHGIGSLWSGDHRNFEPRLGVAWDVTGKGTTVFRAGGGIVNETWTATTFTGQLFQNAAVSISAVPTAAVITCAGITGENTCPSTGGGTDANGAATIASNQLCWNAGPVGLNVGCPAGGQSTVLPSLTKPQCGDGVGGNPSPCNIMGTNPHLRTPFVVNYNLSVTHTFGPDMSLQVAYVGNKGYRLLSFPDINQPQLGSAYCLNSLTPAQAADACANLASPGSNAMQESRPYFAKFPYLGVITVVGNKAYSNYNSLQATFTRRMSHGLAITAGYTYGHALDNGSLNRFGVNPENSQNLAGEYGDGDFDVRHRLTATVTYNIPGIKGYGHLLEGWQLNSIITYATSQPWLAFDSVDNFSGTGENADRWNIRGSPANFRSGFDSFPLCQGFNGTLAGNTSTNVTCTIATPQGTPQLLTGAALTSAVAGCQSSAVSGPTLAAAGCYVSPKGGSYITPPELGTFGDMGRNIFRDQGLKGWDISIFKNFTFKERYGVQARWEVFNVLNHPVAANPYGATDGVNTGNSLGGGSEVGAAFATPDFGAGNALIGSGSQRVMQLGLKLIF